MFARPRPVRRPAAISGSARNGSIPNPAHTRRAVRRCAIRRTLASGLGLVPSAVSQRWPNGSSTASSTSRSRLPSDRPGSSRHLRRGTTRRARTPSRPWPSTPGAVPNRERTTGIVTNGGTSAAPAPETHDGSRPKATPGSGPPRRPPRKPSPPKAGLAGDLAALRAEILQRYGARLAMVEICIPKDQRAAATRALLFERAASLACVRHSMRLSGRTQRRYSEQPDRRLRWPRMALAVAAARRELCRRAVKPATAFGPRLLFTPV